MAEFEKPRIDNQFIIDATIQEEFSQEEIYRIKTNGSTAEKKMLSSFEEAVYSWADGGFVGDKPSPNNKGLSFVIEKLKADIDSVCSDVYSKYQKFSIEYALREGQAKAFKEAGYTGELGGQVKAFAEATGKNDAEATNIVLEQANSLRGALDLIGKLRMRKNELAYLTSIDDVELRANQIMLAISNIAKQLG